MSTEDIFMRATSHMADGDVKLSDAQRSAFYGLQKQAIDGNCNVPAPPKGNISARGKYDAWKSYSGLPKNVAMQKYIEALQKVDPSFHADGSSTSRVSYASSSLENKESRIVKEGTLFKQKDIFKGWRARYFVLDEMFLHYYAKQGDVVPLKSILVLGSTVATVKSTKVGEQEYFPFVIANHKSQKTYNLSVHTEAEAQEWIKALQSVIHNPVPSSQYSGNIDRLMPRRPKPDADLDSKSSPFFPIRDEMALQAIPEKFLPKTTKAVQVVTENCNSDEDWTPLFEKEDVVAHWKTSNAGLCVKSETTVVYSLLDVFSLLVNEARRKEFDYTLSACRTVKKFSNNTTVEFSRFKQVWPTPSRDLCNITHWRLLADNTVVLVAFSEKFEDLCPLEEGVVRAELIVQGYVLSASKSGTRIQFVSQTDVRDMPDEVLAMIGKKQPMNLALVKRVLDADKEAGKIHTPRILQRSKCPAFEELLYAFEVANSGKSALSVAVAQIGESSSETTDSKSGDSSAGGASTPTCNVISPSTAPPEHAPTENPSSLSTISLFVLFIPVTLYYAVGRQYRAFAFIMGVAFAVEYVFRVHMGTPRKKTDSYGLSHVPSGHIDCSFSIDLTRLLRFLESRRDSSGVEITISHIALKAAGIAISEIPNLNGYVINDDFYFAKKSGVDISLSMEIFGNETVMMKVNNVNVKPVDYLADEIKNRKKVIMNEGPTTPKLLKVIFAVLPKFFAGYVRQFCFYLGAKAGVSVPLLGIEAFPQGVCNIVTIPSKEKSEGDVEVSLIPNRLDSGAPVCLTIGSVSLQPMYDENNKLSAQHVLNIAVSIDSKACSLAEGKRFAARVQQLMSSPNLLDKIDRMKAMSKEDAKMAAEKAATHAAIFKRH